MYPNIVHPQNTGVPFACAPSLYPPETQNLKKTTEVGDFSFFPKPIQNVVPSGIMSVKDAYQSISGEKYATITRVLRELTSKEAARNYKARNFDYVCFSGIFARRSESGLIRHSNLLTFDFDKVLKPYRLKQNLIGNPYFETVLAFISPSGEGVKWIIKIDLNTHTHLQWFKGVASYLRVSYHLEVDQSGKDISRCCFLPHDADAYINEKYI